LAARKHHQPFFVLSHFLHTHKKTAQEEAELRNPVAPHFDITQRSKLQCVTVLLPVQKASSLTEALQLCINEPQCTAVVRLARGHCALLFSAGLVCA
jgi:hypothetical protein